MDFKDVIVFLSPYLAIFLCVFILVVCFLIRNTTPNPIEFENRFPQQMDEQRQERFRIANINRLELADSMINYAIYLREKMERERIKEDIVIFINPGDEKPVLGRLIVD